MRIGDRDPGDVELAGTGVNDCLRRDAPGFQCQADGEGLHHGTGLKGVGQRAVAQLLAREIAALGRHIARVIGQRQHFAGDNIEHHHTASLGLELLYRVMQLLISEELHLAVDAELQIGSVDWRNLLAHILYHPTQTVLDDAARTIVTRELLVEGQLHAFLSDVFDVCETHHVRRRLAFGILAFVFLALVDAGDTERHDLLRHRIVDLALEPDKSLVFVFEPFVQFCQRHFQQLGQLRQLHRIAVNVLRNSPDAGRRHTGGQDQTIAVQNAAAIGRQFQRTRKAHFALFLKKGVGNHLNVGGARRQTHKAERDGRDNELAAPDRCRTGQQRT